MGCIRLSELTKSIDDCLSLDSARLASAGDAAGRQARLATVGMSTSGFERFGFNHRDEAECRFAEQTTLRGACHPHFVSTVLLYWIVSYMHIAPIYHRRYFIAALPPLFWFAGAATDQAVACISPWLTYSNRRSPRNLDRRDAGAGRCLPTAGLDRHA